MNLLIEFANGGGRNAGVGVAVSIDDGEKNVFARAVVQLPEDRGRDDDDLRLFVCEQGAEIDGEDTTSSLAGGKNRGGAASTSGSCSAAIISFALQALTPMEPSAESASMRMSGCFESCTPFIRIVQASSVFLPAGVWLRSCGMGGGVVSDESLAGA
jgi:hypothetical protein